MSVFIGRGHHPLAKTFCLTSELCMTHVAHLLPNPKHKICAGRPKLSHPKQPIIRYNKTTRIEKLMFAFVLGYRVHKKGPKTHPSNKHFFCNNFVVF